MTGLTSGMMDKTWLDWAALWSWEITTIIYGNCKATGWLQIFWNLRKI